MEIKEIKKKAYGGWTVNGEDLTPAELLEKYCPSKIVSENPQSWFLIALHYSIENADSPHYGWRELFALHDVDEDYKPIDDWDAKYHILLY